MRRPELVDQVLHGRLHAGDRGDEHRHVAHRQPAGRPGPDRPDQTGAGQGRAEAGQRRVHAQLAAVLPRPRGVRGRGLGQHPAPEQVTQPEQPDLLRRGQAAEQLAVEQLPALGRRDRPQHRRPGPAQPQLAGEGRHRGRQHQRRHHRADQQQRAEEAGQREHSPDAPERVVQQLARTGPAGLLRHPEPVPEGRVLHPGDPGHPVHRLVEPVQREQADRPVELAAQVARQQRQDRGHDAEAGQRERGPERSPVLRDVVQQQLEQPGRGDREEAGDDLARAVRQGRPGRRAGAQPGGRGQEPGQVPPRDTVGHAPAGTGSESRP